MTRIEKLLFRFLANPTSLRYPQIEKLLCQLGFEKINAKGSHVKLRHSSLDRDVIIPVHNNECKIRYKKKIAKLIQKFNLKISFS